MLFVSKYVLTFILLGMFILFLPVQVFAGSYNGGAYDQGTYNQGASASTPPSNNSSSSSSGSGSGSGGGGNGGGCSASAPAKAPDLFQADTSSNKATLYLSSPGNYAKYQIIYGYSQDDERFSAMIDVNPQLWIVPVTINQLADNTVYFFKAKAVNDCTPGPVSNVLGVKTTASLKQTGRYFKNSGIVQKAWSNAKATASDLTSKPAVGISEPVPETITAPLPNQQLTTPSTQINSVPAPAVSPAPSPKASGWWGNIVNTFKNLFHL